MSLVKVGPVHLQVMGRDRSKTVCGVFNMHNQIFGGLVPSSRPFAAMPVITSYEIAELVGSRHDKVKQSIERLSERSVIALPPMGEKATAGRPSAYYIFEGERGKRDSIIVVAQLSREFTARLVDRWHELESAVSKPVQIPQSFAEALRMAADLEEEKERLQLQLTEAAPKVEFVDRYVTANGSMTFRQVAKLLGAKNQSFVCFSSKTASCIASAMFLRHSISTSKPEGLKFGPAQPTPQITHSASHASLPRAFSGLAGCGRLTMRKGVMSESTANA